MRKWFWQWGAYTEEKWKLYVHSWGHKPNGPYETHTGETGSTSKEEFYNKRVKPKRTSTIQTRYPMVSFNTVASSNVVSSTIHGPNDATVFNYTKPKNISKEFLNASQPESTEIIENDLDILCSVKQEQKFASDKKKVDEFFKKKLSREQKNTVLKHH